MSLQLVRRAMITGGLRITAAIIFFILGGLSLDAQNYLTQAGQPAFSTLFPVENGFINISNGGLHLEIPMGAYPQRGGRPFKTNFTYDSEIWQPVFVGTAATGSFVWQPTNIPVSFGGWRFNTSADVGVVNYSTIGQPD